MKSKQVNTILKYFNEPQLIHSEVWIMRPKYNDFEVIIHASYDKCWEEAKRQVNGYFKYVKP